MEYLQLCQNYYDKQTKRSKTEVVYNFGRKDQVDVTTIQQLVANLANYIAKETGGIVPQLFATGPGPVATFMGSVNLGGTWLLDRLWHRIGIANALKSVLADRKYDIPWNG